MQHIWGIALLAAASLAHGQSATDRALVEQAKTALTYNFKDAGSAQYRNVGLYKSSTGKGGDIVCGEVNAKNSYGAYVGFQRFAVWQSVVVIERPDDPWRDTLGPKLCHELVTRIP